VHKIPIDAYTQVPDRTYHGIVSQDALVGLEICELIACEDRFKVASADRYYIVCVGFLRGTHFDLHIIKIIRHTYSRWCVPYTRNGSNRQKRTENLRQCFIIFYLFITLILYCTHLAHLSRCTVLFVIGTKKKKKICQKNGRAPVDYSTYLLLLLLLLLLYEP